MIWKLFVAIVGTFFLAMIAFLAKGAEIPSTEFGRNTVTVAPTKAPTTAQDAFSEMKIEKIGNHTYYSETMFDLRGRTEEEREEVLSQMRKADKQLNRDIFVTGFNSEFGTENFRLFGLRMTNGIAEAKMSLNSGWDMEKDEVLWGSHRYGLIEFMPEVTIDPEGVMQAELLFEKVYNLAKDNEKYIFEHRRTEPISGTYMLKANEEGVVYYEFRINKYTTIEVNAKTGEVMNEYYWDGVYVD